jgi:group II intron reverse transcriptase/maturase
VQLACATLTSAIFEQDFLDCSHGSRPGRSAKEAVIELAHALQYDGYHHVVEADIRGFFEHMDHDWVLRMLGERIDDRAFLGLIRKWLKAGILDTDGQVLHPGTGTPQGGIVSPVLANAYLHYALDLWFERVVTPRCRGKALLCRYADDFVCAFASKDDAERFFAVLPKRLEKFGLQVAPEKTRLMCFSRARPDPATRIAFLGFELYWQRTFRGRSQLVRRAGCRALAAGGAGHDGLDQEPPAPAGQGVHRRTQPTADRALQLLRVARQCRRSVAIPHRSRGRGVQMAEPARGQTQALHLGRVQTRPQAARRRPPAHPHASERAA